MRRTDEEQRKRRRGRRGGVVVTDTRRALLRLLPPALLLIALLAASAPVVASRRDRHRRAHGDGTASLPESTTTFFAHTFDAAAAATARLDAAIKAATQQLPSPSPAPAPATATATAAPPPTVPGGGPLPPPLPIPDTADDQSSSSSGARAGQQLPPQQPRCLTALAFVSSDAGAEALPSCPPPSDASLSFVEARFQNLRQESGRAPGAGVGGPPARLTACLAFAKGGCPAAAGPFLSDVALAPPGGCGSLGNSGGSSDPWQFGGPLWPGPGAPGLCVRRTRDPARSLSDVRVAYVRVASGGDQQAAMQRRDQDRREACPRGFRPAPGGVLSGGGSSSSNGNNKAGVLEAFFCAAGQPAPVGGASFRPPPGSLVPERGLLALPTGPPLAALAGAAALLGLKTDARLLLAAHSDGGADLAAPGLNGGRGGGGCLSLPTGGKGGAAAQRLSLIGDGLRVVAAAACGTLGLSDDAWSDAYAHQHWQLERMNDQAGGGGGGGSVWRVKSRLTGECLTGAGDALLVAQQPCGKTASGAPLPWQLWDLDFAGAAPAPYWTLRSLAPPVNARAAAAARQRNGGASAPQAVISAAAAAAAAPPTPSPAAGPVPLCASVYHDVDDYYDLGDPDQKPPEDRGLDPGAVPIAFAPALVLRPCAAVKDARQRFSVLASATAFTSPVPGGVVLGAAWGARDGGEPGGRPSPAPAPGGLLSLNRTAEGTDDPLQGLVSLIQFGAALISKNKTGSGGSSRAQAGGGSRPPSPSRSSSPSAPRPPSSSSAPRPARPSSSSSSSGGGGGSGRGRGRGDNNSNRGRNGAGAAAPAPPQPKRPQPQAPPRPQAPPPPPPRPLPPMQQQRSQQPPPQRPPQQQQPQQLHQQQSQRPPQRASSSGGPSPSRRRNSGGGGGGRGRH